MSVRFKRLVPRREGSRVPHSLRPTILLQRPGVHRGVMECDLPESASSTGDDFAAEANQLPTSAFGRP